MLRFVIAFAIVFAFLFGTLWALRRSRLEEPSPEVIERAKARERELEAQERLERDD